MTRKDFLFLADALKQGRPALPWTGVRYPLYLGWRRAVTSVADAIAAQTNKFDAELFCKNAGVVETEATTGERQ